ncbi:hypothetical protein M434DRAFT_18585 [Hypoxylon sp. CO27-5]|nr:hypothetical protein M434DRAFT_18585 [Hypoxylon sp. CO27-5]
MAPPECKDHKATTNGTPLVATTLPLSLPSTSQPLLTSGLGQLPSSVPIEVPTKNPDPSTHSPIEHAETEAASGSANVGTKRPASLDDKNDEPPRTLKRRKISASLPGSWKYAFQPIIDTVPSEDASMVCVRNWFLRIGALHGLQKRDLSDLGRSAMLGHNLLQADYSNIKDYLLSIADHNKCLEMHAPLFAADAYEAMQSKKAMEAKAADEDSIEANTSEATQA